MIEFEFLDVEIPGFKPEFFVSTLSDLIKSESFNEGHITVVFVTDEYLLELNKRHLNHDYYTDIITFDYTELNFVSGDLFVSYERVIENAMQYNVTLYSELCRVIYHGVLHLCGYNDKSEDEQIIMRAKESFYLLKYVSRETLS